MACCMVKHAPLQIRHYFTGMRIFVALFLASALLAQQAPPPPKTDKPGDDLPPPITVDVDVVSVLTSVRDKRGGLVGNLEKADFTVLEDGKPQTIKYFS